jgi:putative DNA primase/helicase
MPPESRRPGVLPEALRELTRDLPPPQAKPNGAAARTFDFHLTDLGACQRLVARHGARLRYCHPWKKWLVWDGKRWKPDATAEVLQLARETVRSIYNEAAATQDTNTRKALASYAQKYESEARLSAMVSLAESEYGVPVLPEQLDACRWLLNIDNGTLDLRTGNLQPHDPANLITKLAPVAYDAHAVGPVWLKFLEKVTGGSLPIAKFLQEAVGSSLSGEVLEEVLLVLYGTGANGKSTFVETILGMMGDYATKTPTTTLMDQRRDGSVPNDIARLRGVRMVAAVESKEGRRLNEERVKELTGRDTVTARFLFAEWFDFKPEFTLWLATNHRPEVRGTDHAIWRRLRLIPFTVTIPADQQDRRLPDKLREEWPGILRWAVEGCRRWLAAEGLSAPAEVTGATQAWQADADILGEFLEGYTLGDPDDWVQSAELWAAYQEWCKGERFSLTRRQFARALADKGLVQQRMHAGRVWRGIRKGT